MEKRYQVFVSSTFEDLREEREGVLRALLAIDCFPASMEAFGAASVTPWDIITSTIDLCDYYVLITAGRYGSTDESGVSYTEREYDYARSNGIPCLVFAHQNPSNLPVSNTETEQLQRDRLRFFHEKLESAHLRQTWRNADDLRAQVITSLTKEMRRNPQTGWVRASEAADIDTFKRLSDAQEEVSKLQHQLAASSNSVVKDADFLQSSIYLSFQVSDFSKFAANGLPRDSGIDPGASFNIEMIDVFESAGPKFYEGTSIHGLALHIAKHHPQVVDGQFLSDTLTFRLRDRTVSSVVFNKIARSIAFSLEASGLVTSTPATSQAGAMTMNTVLYEFSERGRRLYARVNSEKS